MTLILNVEWLHKLLLLLSEHKVTGIYVFFVFFIYRIIDVAYSKAQKEYKESCHTENVYTSIRLEYERKAVIHNLCLFVMIIGFFVIFFSELSLLSSSEKVVREGKLRFLSLSMSDQGSMIKMLNGRLPLFYGGKEVAWIGKTIDNSNRIIELDFIILVPQSAANNLSNSRIEVRPPEPGVEKYIKTQIESTITSEITHEKGQQYIDTKNYDMVYLQYSEKGYYDFCVIEERLTISQECKNKVEVAKISKV